MRARLADLWSIYPYVIGALSACQWHIIPPLHTTATIYAAQTNCRKNSSSMSGMICLGIMEVCSYALP